MSAGRPDQRWRTRLYQAERARKAQLEQHARQVAERAAKVQIEEEARKSRPVRDTDRYHEALAGIPFSIPGDHAKLAVAETYLRLVDIAVQCMNSRSREAVLCWPDVNPSASAVATLIALADNFSTPSIKYDGLDALAAPTGMRALIYPYARTAH